MPTGDPLPAHSFGTITVRLVNDNIAARRVEALVNEANDRLVLGGHAARAPLSRGGLACALTDGVRSSAMPLLGEGVGGLGVQQALEAILEAIEDVSTNYSWTVDVELVVHDVEKFVEAGGLFREYGGRAAREAEDAEGAAQFLKLLLREPGAAP